MIEMKASLERIQLKVTEGLAVLAPHLQSWLHEHMIEPRQVCLATDAAGNSIKTLWLITDHISKNDSSYRIVYDEDEEAFGLVHARHQR